MSVETDAIQKQINSITGQIGSLQDKKRKLEKAIEDLEFVTGRVRFKKNDFKERLSRQRSVINEFNYVENAVIARQCQEALSELYGEKLSAVVISNLDAYLYEVDVTLSQARGQLSQTFADIASSERMLSEKNRALSEAEEKEKSQ